MTKDEDGKTLKAGDFITFSYGIPPTSVTAQLFDRNGDLWIHCIWPEGVKPQKEKLSRVQMWYQIWKAPAISIPKTGR